MAVVVVAAVAKEQTVRAAQLDTVRAAQPVGDVAQRRSCSSLQTLPAKTSMLAHVRLCSSLQTLPANTRSSTSHSRRRHLTPTPHAIHNPTQPNPDPTQPNPTRPSSAQPSPTKPNPT